MNIIELPEIIPVFPLNGALLLPNGDLPLNIFEPRYVSMINHAMKDNKMIGMIQRNPNSKSPNDLYTIGCLGKITQYNETDDGRYLINLKGLIRFKMVKELVSKDDFRSLYVDYSKYENDLNNNFNECYDKNKFIKEAKSYLSKNNMQINWSSLGEIDQTLLITTFASICPFSNAEKQMLLECKNTNEIPNIMINLFKMYDAKESGKSLN